ncbi:MAG: ROK family protein, partial [Candidatus Andersenbacteria bacterium]|nr:ROK family protein [Candidatus Andersenbacteria bacterium]
IDAGATWIKAGLFSPELEIIKTVKTASGAGRGIKEYIDSIAAAVEKLGVSKVEAAGLALPATLTADGREVKYAGNIKGLTVGSRPVPVSHFVPGLLNPANVAVENDANCAALAEWQKRRGEGRPEIRLLHLTWGTGIGTGLVVDGKIQYGWEGGHLPVSWENPVPGACGCGSRVDLEARIAVPKLVSLARSKIEGLGDAKEAFKNILDQAEAGNLAAGEVIEEALLWMARGLLAMSIVAYPDLVAIGGAAMSRDWLLADLRRKAADEASGYLADALKPQTIWRANLGNEAGMMGAAILALEKS